MRVAVTSPGGTTERALAVLMAPGCLAGRDEPGDRRRHGAFAGAVVLNGFRQNDGGGPGERNDRQ